MRVMKWSMIALAVSAGTSQFAMASAQDDAKGFVEDSTFSINTRALYFSRDNRNNKSGTSYTRESGLGFNGLCQSGFTQGTIGFGTDAFAYGGIKLDTGRGRVGQEGRLTWASSVVFSRLNGWASRIATLLKGLVITASL